MGLRWNWDLQIRHLVVESDCLEIIEVLNYHENGEGYTCSILVEIFQLVDTKHDANLHHVWCPREMNKVARLQIVPNSWAGIGSFLRGS